MSFKENSGKKQEKTPDFLRNKTPYNFFYKKFTINSYFDIDLILYISMGVEREFIGADQKVHLTVIEPYQHGSMTATVITFRTAPLFFIYTHQPFLNN